MQTLLAIDIGNTHTHWGLVRGGTVSRRGILPTGEDLSAQLPDAPIDRAVFCSVVPQAVRPLERFLKAKKIPFTALTQKTFPLPICYATPATLGHDRLALCLGALALGLPRAVVVDIGTAVTVDFVDAKKGFLGGFITPGLGLMLDSLHTHTAQLPALRVEDIQFPAGIPQTTAHAVGAGCALAFAGAVGALVARVCAVAQGNPPVVATGNGAAALTRCLAPRHEPDLLLKGLARFAETAAAC